MSQNSEMRRNEESESIPTGASFEHGREIEFNLTGEYLKSSTIDLILKRNIFLEDQLRNLEKKYKEEFKEIVKENNENIKKFTKQIESLNKRIDELVKSKERWLEVPDFLIKDAVKEFLENEK